MPDTLFSTIRDAFQTNEFFAGGFLVMVLAAAASVGWRVARLGAMVAARRLTLSVVVRDRDVFAWLGDWVAHQQYGERCRRLSVESLHIEREGDTERRTEQVLVFPPGAGTHVFTHNGRLFWLTRAFDDQHAPPGSMPREYRTLRTVGRDPAVIRQVLRGGRAQPAAAERPDVRLLRRPVQRLATHFDLDLYAINLAGRGMSDERLLADLAGTRPNSILLIEDVDAIWEQRTKTGDQASTVTFSGLLNAVDGVVAQEHRILILTTNHVDRLDPALTRPGRIDVRQSFDLATADQVRRLFLRSFPSHDELARELEAAVPDGTIAPASLQNTLLVHRDDPAAAARTVAEMGRFGGMGSEQGAEPLAPRRQQRRAAWRTGSGVGGRRSAAETRPPVRNLEPYPFSYGPG